MGNLKAGFFYQVCDDVKSLFTRDFQFSQKSNRPRSGFSWHNGQETVRVCLDTVKNWKLKLKIKKHCSKIIIKYVNSTVGPIFNEKVTEKWNLWIREQYTMCTDWLKKIRKVKLCDYCSLNSVWTVATSLKNAWKKKKEKRRRRRVEN